MGHGRLGPLGRMGDKRAMIPNVESAVMAWAEPRRVFIVGKRIIDFKVHESTYEKTANVVRVPSGQALEMKPEGQRKWNKEKLFTDTTLELKVDDIIIFDCQDGERFRVVNKADYSQSGFYEYDLLSDYHG